MTDKTGRGGGYLYMLGGRVWGATKRAKKVWKDTRVNCRKWDGATSGIVSTDIHGSCEELWQVQSFRVLEESFHTPSSGICCLRGAVNFFVLLVGYEKRFWQFHDWNQFILCLTFCLSASSETREKPDFGDKKPQFYWNLNIVVWRADTSG